MSQIKRRSVKTQFGLLCIVEEAGEITRLDWGISAASMGMVTSTEGVGAIVGLSRASAAQIATKRQTSFR